jgi:hypothetical protein
MVSRVQQTADGFSRRRERLGIRAAKSWRDARLARDATHVEAMGFEFEAIGRINACIHQESRTVCQSPTEHIFAVQSRLVYPSELNSAV